MGKGRGRRLETNSVLIYELATGGSIWIDFLIHQRLVSTQLGISSHKMGCNWIYHHGDWILFVECSFFKVEDKRVQSNKWTDDGDRPWLNSDNWIMRRRMRS